MPVDHDGCMSRFYRHVTGRKPRKNIPKRILSGVLVSVLCVFSFFVYTTVFAEVSQLGPADFVNGSHTVDKQPELEFYLSYDELEEDWVLPLSYRIEISNSYTNEADFGNNLVVSYESDQSIEPGEVPEQYSFKVGQEAGDGSYALVDEGPETIGFEDQELEDGAYWWRVMTIDSDTPAQESDWVYAGVEDGAPAFIVDTTAPGVVLDAITPNPTDETSVTLTGTSTDEWDTVSNVQFQVNGILSSWINCAADDESFNQSEEDFTCNVDLSGLGDGVHTIYVRAEDDGGNVTEFELANQFPNRSVTVDTTAPAIELDEDDFGLVNDDSVQLTGTAEDALGTVVSVAFQVNDDDGDGWVSCIAEDGNFGSNEEDFICDVEALDEGDHLIYLRSTDNLGNATSSGYVTASVSVDTVAPVIGDVEAESVSGSSATIIWTTTEDADSWVEYGISTGYGSEPAGQSDVLDMDHSVGLSGLLSCTTYFYQVSSTDEAGNTDSSDGYSFTTDGCVGGASVVEQITEEVDGEIGEVIEFVDGDGQGIELDIPGGFLPLDAGAVFQIKKLDASSVNDDIGSPDDFSWIGNYAYDLKAFSGPDTIETEFEQEIGITIYFDESDLSGIELSSVQIFRWSGAEWVELNNCVVDEVGYSVTCETMNFSVFGLFGEGEAPTPIPTTPPSSSGSQSSSRHNNGYVCTGTKPVGVPDLFQIDAGNTQAILYFAPVRGSVNKYAIVYGLEPGEERYAVEFDQGESGGVLSYTVNHLSPNSTYYFRMRSGNGCVPGDWSNEMQITTTRSSVGGVSYYKDFLSRILSIFPKQVTSLGNGSATLTSGIACEHIVQPGDSLWNISLARYGMGTKYVDIMGENGIQTDFIRVGQLLRVGC